MLSNIARSFLNKSSTATQFRTIAARRTLTTTTTTSTTTENNQEQQPSNDDEQLKQKLAKCESDVAELKDKYMRSLAEIENTRFRMNKQIEDAKVFGIQGFCRDLLEVADVLRLAITNTDPTKLAAISDEEKGKLMAMYNGLVMTETCLLKIFEKHRLVKINPGEGEKFDPNQHEAIFRMPVDGKPSGTVSVVTKVGFKLNERVIRAAQVGVVQ